jgi:V8-like Glu-specific endopeptidase
VKKLLVLAIAVLFLTLPVFGLTAAETKAHAASYQIGQITVSGGGRCSATAIGPHALLTASHCEAPTDELYIRGQEGNPFQIVGRIRDEQDHTIFLLKGVTFSDYADVLPADKFEQGEDVFTFGNPGKWQDIYQRGYVAGVLVDDSLAAALGHGDPDEVLLDFQAYPGESGAGVFNSEGKLLTVVAADDIQAKPDEAISFASAYRLNFSPEQLLRAKTFSAEAK